MRRLLALLLVLWAVPAWADTHAAATCERDAVYTALQAATAGDTVTIPAGTCTWTTATYWTAPANVIVHGAGSESTLGGGDATVIIDDINRSGSDVPLLEISTNATGTFRLWGLTIRGSGNAYALTTAGSLRVGGSSQQFRLDHLHFDHISMTGLMTVNAAYGVVDNCLFDLPTAGLAVRLYASEWGGHWNGDGSWADDSTLGSARFVYLEDNTFNGYGGADDSYAGSRFVIRFNTMNKVATQTHPTGGSGRGRGTRAWEIYRNTTNTPNDESDFNFFFLSSGTGVIWDNTASTGYKNFVSIHSMRKTNSTYTQTATPNGWGYCGTAFDGTGSAWDQNTDAGTGYACLDQPGRGKADLLSGDFPSAVNTTTGTIAWPHQALEPVYEWGNTWVAVPGEPGSFWAIYEPTVLAADRDYYIGTGNSACNPGAGSCTSGVGVGTLAQRPANCTTSSETGGGVGWWATDQGTWNANGADGVLYRCSATNTWTVYYTPYTYPHPLRGAGSPPSAPTNVRIR